MPRIFEETPNRLAADTAYGSGPNLSWLVEERGIEPHIPVWDKTARADGCISAREFIWDEEGDCYHCPQGKILTTKGTLHADDIVIYRASAFDCGDCPLKPRCCPKIPARKIRRSIHEDARDYARIIGRTKAYEQSAKDRKKVEIKPPHPLASAPPLPAWNSLLPTAVFGLEQELRLQLAHQCFGK